MSFCDLLKRSGGNRFGRGVKTMRGNGPLGELVGFVGGVGGVTSGVCSKGGDGLAC